MVPRGVALTTGTRARWQPPPPPSTWTESGRTPILHQVSKVADEREFLRQREDLLQSVERISVAFDPHTVSCLALGKMHEALLIGDDPDRGLFLCPTRCDLD